jgi:hypothetical protein
MLIIICEISSSHGGEYDVQNCLLGYIIIILHGSTSQKTILNIIIISSLLHTHLSLPHEVFNDPVQVLHQTLRSKVVVSSLTRYLTAFRV